jgi:hypothetical protein
MVMVVKLKMFCPATCGTAVNFVGSKITTLPGVTLEKSRGPSAPVEPLLNWAEDFSYVTFHWEQLSGHLAFAHRLNEITN